MSCEEASSSEAATDVIVPSGSSCTLLGTVIDGDFRASGPGEISLSNIIVNGNVEIVGSFGVVDIDGVVVSGDIVITGADTTFIQVANAQVEGNISLSDNKISGKIAEGTGMILIRPVQIGGNLLVTGNEIGAGALLGSCASGGNTVGGDVIVKKNVASFGLAVNCSEIAGSVIAEDNRAFGGNDMKDEDIQITGNTIGGSVMMIGNTAPDQIAIGDAFAEPIQPKLFINRISGDLVCRGNDPDPTTEATEEMDFRPVEEGNVVAGTIDCAD